LVLTIGLADSPLVVAQRLPTPFLVVSDLLLDHAPLLVQSSARKHQERILRFRLELLQELAISAASECGPWFKAPLPVKLVSEIVRFAIQKVSKIHSRPFQVHGIDLKVAPINGPVRVVMIDFACASRIFGALYR
jgi:hypothetical protein